MGDQFVADYIGSLCGAINKANEDITILEKALRPFADKEECETGCLVGLDEDHTANCEECQQILFARNALKETNGR